MDYKCDIIKMGVFKLFTVLLFYLLLIGALVGTGIVFVVAVTIGKDCVYRKSCLFCQVSISPSSKNPLLLQKYIS